MRRHRPSVTVMTDRTATTPEALFTVEPADYGSGSVGICLPCGDRTRKMGSERKAAAAIADHVRAKHADLLSPADG